MERPSKRARLLDDAESSDSAGEGGVTLKINEEYAARHKHNAERTERHRLEEKFKNDPDGSESDSDSESEDEGDLATQALDQEIAATLNAIRSKDPRIYDKESKFYDPDEASKVGPRTKQPKPVHLRDYHRQNLLNGDKTGDEDLAPTYAEEQSAVKRELLDQMRNGSGAASDEDGNGAASDEEDLFKRKPGQEIVRAAQAEEPVDLELADQDPEGYLDKFMASRVWKPSESSNFQPFESDDEDDDRADDFEQAYNMRFEDPQHANEKLLAYSRDAAEKYSVRRDEPKGRKKARQDERDRKAAEKAERDQDRARLRTLKIDEAHEKWLKVREAAGLKRQTLPDEQLMAFLEKGFEGGDWDTEMQKLLGNAYHDEGDDDDLEIDVKASGHGEGDKESKRKKKHKKPTWDDDIDIGDIVPDFDEEEKLQRRRIRASEEEVTSDVSMPDAQDVDEDMPVQQPAEESKAAKKRQSRIARQKISELVDNQLASDELPRSKHSGFRYREASPTMYGLSARDILMADDSQLNEYVGLKKLATYREQEKKERDRKKLGKKARLRKWRRETFGKDFSEDAPAATTEDKEFEEWFNRSRGLESRPTSTKGKKKREAKDMDDAGDNGDGRNKRKKKKPRKAKSSKAETPAAEDATS